MKKFNDQYFLSSGNVVYTLVVDISLPIEEQREQVMYWLRYLKSKLRKFEDATIFMIGNKSDLTTKQQQEESTNFFLSLKNQGYSLDWIIISARKSLNVNNLITSLSNTCKFFLKSESYFGIPRLYKQVGEKLLNMQKKGKILLGEQFT